jgi:[ribosomal protein S18]-alanine N-acetyltransferase
MMGLRNVAGTDLEMLFELDQICFPAGIAYSVAEIRSLLTSLRTTGLVAEEDEAIAGFVLAQTVRGRGGYGGHIVTIDVAPEFRRRGVGQVLMQQIEEQMWKAGAEWMRLEVAVDNHGALTFYEQLGFSKIGSIRGYYQGNLDAVVMEKTLARQGG